MAVYCHAVLRPPKGLWARSAQSRFRISDLQKLVTRTLRKLWKEENIFNQLRASIKPLTLTSHKDWMISSQGQVQGKESYSNYCIKARKRIRRHLDQKERKLSLFTDDMTVYKENIFAFNKHAARMTEFSRLGSIPDQHVKVSLYFYRLATKNQKLRFKNQYCLQLHQKY